MPCSLTDAATGEGVLGLDPRGSLAAQPCSEQPTLVAWQAAPHSWTMTHLEAAGSHWAKKEPVVATYGVIDPLADEDCLPHCAWAGFDPESEEAQEAKKDNALQAQPWPKHLPAEPSLATFVLEPHPALVIHRPVRETWPLLWKWRPVHEQSLAKHLSSSTKALTPWE